MSQPLAQVFLNVNAINWSKKNLKREFQSPSKQGKNLKE